MKTFFIASAICILSYVGWGASLEEEGIGQEYIKSIRYPKISISGDYGFIRHGRFLGQDISSPLDSIWGVGFSFDVGLYKFLNAGAGFGYTMGKFSKDKLMPLHMRFTLFAKPIFNIGERFTFFSRLGGGLSVMALDPVGYFKNEAKKAVRDEIERVYGLQEYAIISPGINMIATVGAEYFFLPRFALALEWGLLGDFYFVSKGDIRSKLTDLKLQKATAPAAINYLNLDFPFTLSLRIIL